MNDNQGEQVIANTGFRQEESLPFIEMKTSEEEWLENRNELQIFLFNYFHTNLNPQNGAECKIEPIVDGIYDPTNFINVWVNGGNSEIFNKFFTELRENSPAKLIAWQNRLEGDDASQIKEMTEAWSNCKEKQLVS